jgi:hypothetical protein
MRQGDEVHDDARDRAQEGLEHLQAAAKELIAAARAALDVAERLVDDPERMTAAVGSVASLGRLLRDVTGPGDGRRQEAEDAPEPEVERIVIQ